MLEQVVAVVVGQHSHQALVQHLPELVLAYYNCVPISDLETPRVEVYFDEIQNQTLQKINGDALSDQSEQVLLACHQGNGLEEPGREQSDVQGLVVDLEDEGLAERDQAGQRVGQLVGGYLLENGAELLVETALLYFSIVII